MNHSTRVSIVVLLGTVLFGVFVHGAIAVAEEVAAVDRNDVEQKFKWNTAAIFDSDDTWESEYASLGEDLEKVEQFRGTLAAGAGPLADYFDQKFSLKQRIDILGIYASLRSDEDVRVPTYQDMDSRATKLSNRFKESVSWEDPEIAGIDADVLRRFIGEDSRLEPYRHYLENKIRRRAHVLSREEERILALAATPLSAPGKIAGMLRNADMDFPSIEDEFGRDVELTSGRYVQFRSSKEVRVRRDAFNGMLSAYEGKVNTIAAALSGAVESHIFYAKARGHESSLHSSLFRNNIPVEVYHNLIEAVGENIAPVHRYVSLRKKALGLEQLHYYDLYPSIAQKAEAELPWDTAVQSVLDAASVLGEPYVADLSKGIQSGWIDVYENEGKRSGAYSSGTKGTMPYILMNYGNNIDGMFTLAHEAGHSMHSLLANRNQAFVNSDYSIFVAEVASTAIEALLQNKMARESEDGNRDDQIALLDRFLQDMMGTMIRQTMFAEFELGIHEMAEAGESLTPQSMCAFYGDLVAKYYGEDMTIDETTTFEWSRIPHFFYNFYVYQYATSYAASYAMAEQIDSADPGAVDRFLALLAEGGSDYPIAQLARAGVDMTKPDPIAAAMRAFEAAVDRLEKLVDAS